MPSQFGQGPTLLPVNEKWVAPDPPMIPSEPKSRPAGVTDRRNRRHNDPDCRRPVGLQPRKKMSHF